MFPKVDVEGTNLWQLVGKVDQQKGSIRKGKREGGNSSGQ